LDNAKQGKPYYFYNAIRKYGPAAFEVQVLGKVETSEELSQLEIELIKQYQSSDSDKGYNSTLGGDGLVPTDTTRRKMSDARKAWHENNPHPFLGKQHKFEVIEQLRKNGKKLVGSINGMFGTKWVFNPSTQETRCIKVEELPVFKEQGWVLGRAPFSKETRKKMSVAAKNREIQIPYTYSEALNG
jgi:hypothetical protein